MDDLSLRPTGRPRNCSCGTCKKCRHADYMRAYYQSKSPSERHRLFVAGRDPERVLQHDRERSKTPAKRESIERSRRRHPERYKARVAVHNAVARGEIAKAPCRDCGAEKVEAHHPDYAKPLEVIWLCRRHHTDEHLRMKDL